MLQCAKKSDMYSHWDQIINRGGWKHIHQSNQATFSARPNVGPGLFIDTIISIFFIVTNDLFVRLVDIDGAVDHDCLNFIFNKNNIIFHAFPPIDTSFEIYVLQYCMYNRITSYVVKLLSVDMFFNVFFRNKRNAK